MAEDITLSKADFCRCHGTRLPCDPLPRKLQAGAANDILANASDVPGLHPFSTLPGRSHCMGTTRSSDTNTPDFIPRLLAVKKNFILWERESQDGSGKRGCPQRKYHRSNCLRKEPRGRTVHFRLPSSHKGEFATYTAWLYREMMKHDNILACI